MKFGFFETMQLLLEASARVNARDLCGKTVLHHLIGPLFKLPDLKVDAGGFFEIQVQKPFGQTGARTSQALTVHTRLREACFTAELSECDNLRALHTETSTYTACGGSKAQFFAKLVD